MCVLKLEAFYLIFYLTFFWRFGCLRLRCAAVRDHFGAQLLPLFSYVRGRLIMKQSFISFYHRHDACIPAATKDPSGTISHLFLSRIPECICPHFYSQVTGITFQTSVRCSVFHFSAPAIAWYHQHTLKPPPAQLSTRSYV